MGLCTRGSYYASATKLLLSLSKEKGEEKKRKKKMQCNSWL